LRRVLAGAADVLVVEDDHAAELAEEPLATLAGTGRPWAVVRSLSKPYGPDLRVALLAGDQASVARVQGRMRLGSGWVSTVLQRLVVQLWREDRATATVARARAEYGRRRDGLVQALADHGVPARGRTGINVWVSTSDESGSVAALRDLGFAVAPGSLYRISSAPGFRISVGALALSDVERLAAAVAVALGRGAPVPPGPVTV
jgi:DNA-binding transcriptional MocR family regulator